MLIQTRRKQNLVASNLQINIDFSNRSSYPGTGTTFLNLVDSTKNNGYLKNSSIYSPDFGGIIQTNGANNGATNAVGDRIDINTSAAGRDRFDGAENFSIFFWVNQIAAAGRIFSTGSAGALSGNDDQCLWQLWIDTGSFYWWNSSGGGTNNLTVAGPWHTPGTWQLIGITYSANEGGNNLMRCYANEVLMMTGSAPTATHSYPARRDNTLLQWTLGGGYYSSCYTQNSSCRFGQFLLYNRTLSQSEVSHNFNVTKLRFGY